MSVSIQQIIAIYSKNSIILNSLQGNLGLDFIHIKENPRKEIEELGKVDLLILDEVMSSKDLPLMRIKTLVNLSGVSVCDNEIFLAKPIFLIDLINITKSVIAPSNELFCCINNDYIYDSRLSKIFSNDKEVSLTNMENSMFIKLLNSDDFTASKDELKEEVWGYHQDTESTTVDTHLYQLKQKLPEELLRIKDNKCSLLIKNLA